MAHGLGEGDSLGVPGEARGVMLRNKRLELDEELLRERVFGIRDSEE